MTRALLSALLVFGDFLARLRGRYMFGIPLWMTRQRALELHYKPQALLALHTSTQGWILDPCDSARFASIERALDNRTVLPPISLLDRGAQMRPRWVVADGRHRLHVARKRRLPGLWVMVGSVARPDELRGPFWLPMRALRLLNPGFSPICVWGDVDSISSPPPQEAV